MRLAVNRHGDATGEPPLLLAHGLFGAARNWTTLAKKMAGRREVIAVDMRNHGDSPWSDACDYLSMAGDLAETIEAETEGRADVLGHSMGGKAAMALALSAPEKVERLIIADIAPVRYAHSHARYVAAMRAMDLGAIRRRSDADPMLADAVAEPMLRAFLLQNLDLKGGEARWRLNLDAFAAGMDAMLDFPSETPHAAFEGDALFLHGGASDYVAPETHDAIHARFPKARIEAIAGAGHWLHAEKPTPFLAAVEAFLGG